MSSKKVPLAQSFVIEDEDEPQVDVMEGVADDQDQPLRLQDLYNFNESGKCTDNFGLKPHQLRLVEALNNQKGSIAIHGVGSGKTRAAIASAKCFLASYPTGQIVVVTPNTTIQNNFQLQMSKLNQGPTPVSFDKTKFHYITFKAITLPDNKDKQVIENIITLKLPFLLIVDEAHNARTPDTSTFFNLHKIAMNATKVLLLTATPVVNNPSDIIPLLALINPTAFNKFFEVNNEEKDKYKVKSKYSKWFKVDASSNELTYLAEIKEALNGFPKCIVSFYRVGPDDLLSFPKTKISEIYFVLDDKQQVQYEEYEKTVLKGATKLTNGFYNKTRQLSNTLKLGSNDNQKLAYIKDLLLNSSTKQKFVVYSYFRAEGSLISDLLKWLPTANIPFAEITGDATAAVRNDAVTKLV